MSPWIRTWHNDAHTRAVERWCVCCGQPYTTLYSLSAHHKQPKSQGGKDKKSNVVAACWDCHEQYHLTCHQGLAARVEDRVRNFARWLQDTSQLRIDLRNKPWLMAPEWLAQEYAHWQETGEYRSMKP